MRTLLAVLLSACSQMPTDSCDAGEPVLCVEMGTVETPGYKPYMQTGLQFCSGGKHELFACPGRNGGCDTGRCFLNALDAGAPCPAELANVLGDCVGERGNTPASCNGGVIVYDECASGTFCSVGSGDGGQFSTRATCR